MPESPFAAKGTLNDAGGAFLSKHYDSFCKMQADMSELRATARPPAKGYQIKWVQKSVVPSFDDHFRITSTADEQHVSS